MLVPTTHREKDAAYVNVGGHQCCHQKGIWDSVEDAIGTSKLGKTCMPHCCDPEIRHAPASTSNLDARPKPKLQTTAMT